MSYKKYSEKLLDPRWQKKRLEVLERCGWKCRACGSETATLHVHHRYYVATREPWNYPDIAYIAYCKDCHKERQQEDAKQTAWEQLLALLFDSNEDGLDALTLGFEIHQRIKAGANREVLRDAIEAFLMDDALVIECIRRSDFRREGFGNATEQEEPFPDPFPTPLPF